MTSSVGNQASQATTDQITENSAPTETLTITLSPKRNKKKKVVRWAAGVVDNEFMNKKSSKKCCVFHKRQVFGEWNDSDTDEEDCDCQTNLQTEDQ